MASFFMLGVLVLLIAFLATVLRNVLHSKGTGRLVACLPLLVFSLSVINIAVRSGEHNLWPIEIAAWLAISFVVHIVVVFVPAFILGYKEHK